MVFSLSYLIAITLTVQSWSAKQVKRRNEAFGQMTISVDSAKGLTRQASKLYSLYFILYLFLVLFNNIS